MNGLAALSIGILSGRLRRKWLPVSLGELIHDIRAALSFNLAHDDITVYNAVQKLLYIGVVGAAMLMLASGLAIWKPVQFHWLTWLFYDFQGARLVHFLGMSAIVAFLLVHVTLSILVPQTIVAMTRGSIRAYAPAGEADSAPADEPVSLATETPGHAPANEPIGTPGDEPGGRAAGAPADVPATGPAEVHTGNSPHATKAGE